MNPYHVPETSDLQTVAIAGNVLPIFRIPPRAFPIDDPDNFSPFDRDV
jgi:hypothetical protein